MPFFGHAKFLLYTRRVTDASQPGYRVAERFGRHQDTLQGNPRKRKRKYHFNHRYDRHNEDIFRHGGLLSTSQAH